MEESNPEQLAPRVSVILVSHNNAASIRKCLRSLEAAPERPVFEIVLVDRGSSDECPQLDAEFPSVSLLRLPRDFGMVKALNIGMRTGKGEYYLFIDSSVEFEPGAIQMLAAALDSASDAAAACPLVVDQTGAVASRVHPLPLPGELQEACPEGDLKGWQLPAAGTVEEVDFIRPPVFMARSYFLKGLRYIDERYGHYWWDLEIMTQIRRAAKKILLVPGARAVAAGPLQESRPPAGLRTLLAADRVLGAAAWCGKHYGWRHGLAFRLHSILRALGNTLTLRQAGFHMGLIFALLNGRKYDGT